MDNKNKDCLIDANGKVTTDELLAVAKVEHDDNGKKFFFIRTYTKGINGGGLVDIHEKMNFAEYNSMIGKPLFPFTKVNVATYTEYMDFLVTKNPSSLRLAERQRLHD